MPIPGDPDYIDPDDPQIEIVSARYIHGDWSHAFLPGGPQLPLRFAFDLLEDRVAAMSILRGSRWEAPTPAEIESLELSLLGPNRDAIDNPEDWVLDTSDQLPSWARSSID